MESHRLLKRTIFYDPEVAYIVASVWLSVIALLIIWRYKRFPFDLQIISGFIGQACSFLMAFAFLTTFYCSYPMLRPLTSSTLLWTWTAI